MDEITETQSIKLGDFKEQLRSIKSNIEIANKELEAVLLLKKQSVSEKETQLSFLTEEIQNIVDTKNLLLIEIQTARRTIQQERDIIELEKTSYPSAVFEHLQKLSTIDRKKNLTEKEIHEDKKFIEYLVVYTSELNKEKAALESVIESTRLSLREKESDLRHLNENFEARKKFSEELLKNLDAEIMVRENRVKELETEIENNVLKTVVPLRSLEEQKRIFELKKDDVRVLYARANRMWAVMFPGKSLEEINLD